MIHILSNNLDAILLWSILSFLELIEQSFFRLSTMIMMGIYRFSWEVI